MGILTLEDKKNELLKGNFVTFDDMNDLATLIANLNYIGINTLMIRQMRKNEYICKVDDVTIRKYKNKLQLAMSQ